MIKKHILACVVMLVLMLTAKLFVYNDGEQEQPIKHVKEPVESPVKDNLISSLNFANEDLPLGDPKVVYRMKKALKEHNFANLQTAKLHTKAAKWFPVIEPILRLYNIPEDFKYIPLVESGLQSGTSIRGASGFWQFMPQTARSFGLKVNKDVDERQNMRKSTVAACKYLNSMFKDLKSWTLVAAAYNVGDNKVKRQIDIQNQDNYFKMKFNRETATYVYKLISMKEIIENPSKYGYKQSPGLIAEADLSKATFKNQVTRYNNLKSHSFL